MVVKWSSAFGHRARALCEDAVRAVGKGRSIMPHRRYLVDAVYPAQITISIRCPERRIYLLYVCMWRVTRMDGEGGYKPWTNSTTQYASSVS